MKKAALAVFALAALGGAYYLGTRTHAAPTVAAPAPEPTPSVVDNLIVPTGLTIPANDPSIKIDQPARVLTGEVRIPTDLLRKEPPANPNFVVPDLSK
jgi:hypothetical protein